MVVFDVVWWFVFGCVFYIYGMNYVFGVMCCFLRVDKGGEVFGEFVIDSYEFVVMFVVVCIEKI